jgi:hypothetical protein
MSAHPAPFDAQLLHRHDLALVPALVPGACLSWALLARFAQRMRQHGLPVQPQRMRYDRRYAQQCLTTAHCVGDAALRALAVELFDVYHVRPTA